MKLLCMLLVFWCAWAAEPPAQLLPPEAVKAELDKIRHTAIVFGEGPKEIHSFIDPKCEMSRRYMQFVMSKKSMLQRYTYYFYLLELKRLDSEGYIGYILDNPQRQKLLLSVMLDDLKPEDAQEYLPGDAAEESMHEITEAAERIGVYKRPYIIYNGVAK